MSEVQVSELKVYAATDEDPDFSDITIIGTLKNKYDGNNPFVLEAAVLRYIAKSFPAIIRYYEYCVKSALEKSK